MKAHDQHLCEILGSAADPGYYTNGTPHEERSPMRSSLAWVLERMVDEEELEIAEDRALSRKLDRFLRDFKAA